MLTKALAQENVEIEVKMAINEVVSSDSVREVRAFLEKHGWTLTTVPVQLDVGFKRDLDPNAYRLEIVGPDAVSKYCNSGTCDSAIITRKNRFDAPRNLPLYNSRVNFKIEETITRDRDIKALLSLANSRDSMKNYRLKNRLSYAHPDQPWRVDITQVKSGTQGAVSLGKSGIGSAIPAYEIEVECVDKRHPNVEGAMDEIVMNLTRVIKRSPFLISSKELLGVANSYISLVYQLPGLRSIQDFDGKYYLNRKPRALATINVGSDVSDEHIYRQKWGATFKADGNNILVYVDKEGEIYAIYDTYTIAKLGGKSPVVSSLFSAELVGNHDILIYEAYFISGAEVWRQPLNERMAAYIKFVDSTTQPPSHAISAKRHFFAEGDMSNAIKSMFDSEANLAYPTDGIVFTRVDDTYGPSLTSGKAYVLKWKPADQNTIDLLVECGDSVATLYAGYRNGTNLADDVLTYVYLKSGSRGGSSQYIKRELCTFPIVKVEGGYMFDETRAGFTDPSTVVKQLLFQHDTILECKFVKSKNPSYIAVPIAIRYDKTENYRRSGVITANDWSTTTIGTMRTIVDPITKADLVATKRPSYSASGTEYYSSVVIERAHQITLINTFHNRIKTGIFNALASYNTGPLLDIGSGRGGDIDKYVAAGFNTVLGVDASYENIYSVEGNAYQRFYEKQKRMVGNLRYLFVAMDATRSWRNSAAFVYKSVLGLFNTADTPNSRFNNTMLKVLIDREEVPSHPVDLQEWKGMLNYNKFPNIVCQFAFHYFLDNAATAATVIANITANIAPGGIFTMTVIDGRVISESPKVISDTDENGRTIRSIERTWDTMSDNVVENYGLKLKVFYQSISTSAIEENAVDIRLLDKLFGDAGWTRHTENTFLDNSFGKLWSWAVTSNGGDLVDMTKASHSYSNLHRIVAYRAPLSG